MASSDRTDLGVLGKEATPFEVGVLRTALMAFMHSQANRAVHLDGRVAAGYCPPGPAINRRKQAEIAGRLIARLPGEIVEMPGMTVCVTCHAGGHDGCTGGRCRCAARAHTSG